MRTFSIRASVRLVVVSGVLLAGVTGGYAAVSLFPAVRAVQRATAPLQATGSRLDNTGEWVDRTARVAEQALEPGGPAALDSLRGWLGAYDLLDLSRPIAGVSDSVRMVLVSVSAAASRFAVTLEEMGALVEMGRRREAAARLAQARGAQQGLLDLAARAQASGLAGVLAAQRRVEVVSRRLAAVFVLWVAGSAIILGSAVRLVRRRLELPLRDLQDGLARIADGDLSVQLVPRTEDEIAALTRQFNQMTAVLRSRAEAQGQMAAASVLLANAAHEVNNPLMSIGAMAESRLADAGVPVPARRDLEEILRQVRRASRLLRGIVRFVRPAPAGELRTDVNDVAREALELLAFQFAADGVAFALDLASGVPRAQVDAQSLEHILVALLANAHEALVRAGAGERQTTVRTWARDGAVCVEVRDSGPGVAPEIRERLFVPFATSRVGGHVGLGLYTARRIAREAGGDLVFEQPAERAGAVFRLTLPAAPARPPVPPAAPVAPPGPAEVRARPTSLAGLKVLLVEDESAVRAPLARFLTRRGASVREAGDGEAALALLASEPADVVIADCRMPVMDGVALYRTLQVRHPSLAARMLFLSGDVAQLGAVGAEIAADRVLPKPLELAELERFILAHQ